MKYVGLICLWLTTLNVTSQITLLKYSSDTERFGLNGKVKSLLIYNLDSIVYDNVLLRIDTLFSEGYLFNQRGMIMTEIHDGVELDSATYEYDKNRLLKIHDWLEGKEIYCTVYWYSGDTTISQTFDQRTNLWVMGDTIIQIFDKSNRLISRTVIAGKEYNDLKVNYDDVNNSSTHIYWRNHFIPDTSIYLLDTHNMTIKKTYSKTHDPVSKLSGEISDDYFYDKNNKVIKQIRTFGPIKYQYTYEYYNEYDFTNNILIQVYWSGNDFINRSVSLYKYQYY